MAGRLSPGCPANRVKGPTLWVHALSVGEVLSALPLVDALREKHPHIPIVFTSTTLQGLGIARRELKGKVHEILRMPLDTRWAVHRLVDCLHPAVFIIVETDLWPGLLHVLRKRGTRTLLVNGRVSPRTYRSYRRFRFLVREMLFGTLDLCLMQSELDRQRLLRIGLSPDRVLTSGNIKFDREWAPMGRDECESLRNGLGLSPADEIWVAGSTHQGEEEILLNAFLRLRPLFPALRLLLAPRRIEESEAIRRSATAKGLRSVFRTDPDAIRKPYDVLVLNTLGELGRIYGVARITFVGGSLVPVGGHNLLEPASFGRPVLFGPHMHNFVLMSQLLTEASGGRMVRDGDELVAAMKELLSSARKTARMGQKAREFVDANRGALGRVLEHVETFL